MPSLDPAAVSARAHQIWVRKGRRQGHALEDWLQAEVELRTEPAAVQTAVPPAAPVPNRAPAASVPPVAPPPPTKSSKPRTSKRKR